MIELKEIRCTCGKLLGKVQEGAAHEIKCPRCKELTRVVHIETEPPLELGDRFAVEGIEGTFIES